MKEKPTETCCVILGMDEAARARIIAEKERIAELANRKRNPKKRRGKRRPPVTKEEFINDGNVFQQAFGKKGKRSK
jgi:hypothetical protein